MRERERKERERERGRGGGGEEWIQNKESAIQYSKTTNIKKRALKNFHLSP